MALFIFGFGQCSKANMPNSNIIALASKNSYSETELLSLIDSVLSLPDAPPWIIEDLQKIIQNNHKEILENTLIDDKQIVEFGKVDFSADEEFEGIPSDDIFHSWSQDKCNPYADSLWKNDTSFSLCLSNKAFTLPVVGAINSHYGYRREYRRMHKGIDIDLERGTPVVSAMCGLVRFAKYSGAYGNVVIIRHADGLETIYSHLSRISVKPGDYLKSGDLVGLGGRTGRATGNHLHFEIRMKGAALNPELMIDMASGSLLATEFDFKPSKTGYDVYAIGAATPALQPQTDFYYKEIKKSNKNYYVIKSGDSLYGIAKRYGLSVKQLKAMNHISQNKSVIRPGQRLRIA